MKKVIAVLTVLLCLALPLSLSAETLFSLSANEDFAVFGKEEGVGARLHMTDEELREYCEANDIVYLAVNQDNSKQIRLSVSSTGFSSGVGRLSTLSDEKIRALIPDLTGETQGEVISAKGQKFIRQELNLRDSGGEYLLTRYITVAAKTYYVLSFYTAPGADTKYIDEVFESFSSPDFTAKVIENLSVWRVVIPLFIVLLSIGCVGIVFLLIRDIRKQTADGEE